MPTDLRTAQQAGGLNSGPVSSASSPSSSSLLNLAKSCLSTRVKMVTRITSSRSTSTEELMIENQWISICCGKKLCCRYFSIRSSNCRPPPCSYYV